MSDTPAGLADDPGVPAQPRLSIVLPCYNSEATLGEQLSALADQTTRYSWEVLVADNASRDKTIGIATAFSNLIPNPRIVDATARRGPAFARNAGARGS